jgi:serine O-acetyltransferase
VVSAGAKVLGGFTVGDGAKVGSNAVVLKEVPAGATVVGVPGRIVEKAGADKAARFAAYAVVDGQDDPYAKAIQKLVEHSAELEQAVAKLNQRLAELEKETQREQLRAVK